MRCNSPLPPPFTGCRFFCNPLSGGGIVISEIKTMKRARTTAVILLFIGVVSSLIAQDAREVLSRAQWHSNT